MYGFEIKQNYVPMICFFSLLRLSLGLCPLYFKEGKSQRRSMPSPSPHVAPNKSPRHSSGKSHCFEIFLK